MFAEGYIGIAGTIGVGKSTLTTDLAKALNFEAILEEVDGNPYLEHFYKDMKSYGTMMQVWLLNHRFRQHREFVTRISVRSSTGISSRAMCSSMRNGSLLSPISDSRLRWERTRGCRRPGRFSERCPTWRPNRRMEMRTS